MADVLSVTAFVMENRLPWPDDGSAPDAGGPFDAGLLYGAGQPRSCSIRKISALGATLRGELANTPGEEVFVELATGQRPAGTVDWVAGGEAGVRFKQPVDMLALINRNLVSQPAERRRMPRVELRCTVQLKWGASLSTAMSRNISAGGLQVEGGSLPPRGTYVSLFIDGLNLPPGEVVWRKGDLAGIELLEDLRWSSIMPWIRDTMRKAAH